MSTVRHAVILAAGMGVRLAEVGRSTPKGLLRLGPRAIVEESLDRLESVGIERVLIVTGHGAEQYEELARRRRGVTTVHNPDFATSGSLRSLWCARAQLDEDALLLESDLIYERRALREALKHSSPDVLLVSEPTGARDEVWVEARDGRLVGMSKDRSTLGTGIVGELIGITRLSRAFFDEMLAVAESLLTTQPRADYELHGLVLAGRRRALPVHVLADLVWAEIDDLGHLERARGTIYPRLRERDALDPIA